MGRLTVRLPVTLHKQLRTLADKEGVSLNQYIVYALTQQVTMAYRVREISEAEISHQKEKYSALLEQLGAATFSEIEQVLAEREGGESIQGLPRETVQQLRERIAEARVKMR